VIQAAAHGDNVSTVLPGFADMRAAFAATPDIQENSRLSSSLLTGLLLLASFPTDRSYIGIAELSRSTGKSQSTVHRYVSTLAAVGLLERDAHTHQYRLRR
jgi:DNA-binding MarR family transcriptional regulator